MQQRSTTRAHASIRRNQEVMSAPAATSEARKGAAVRDPTIWEEADLLELTRNHYEENLQLEFKRSDSLQAAESKKNEVSKDVSAFANCIGGTIVYGIEESQDEPHHAVDLSPVDPKQISKEWLEQVINSRVQPRISGIVINPVELRQSFPGKFAYVVVIPESTTAHQASDKKYYKRFNFQSVPMEDYEVRQTMNRAARPAYNIVLETTHRNALSGAVSVQFRCLLQNVSEIVGHEVSAVLFVPKGWGVQPEEDLVEVGGDEYERVAGEYSPSSTPMSAVASAHPFTKYAIEFRKDVILDGRSLPRMNLKVLVKVFDQFGLALSASFNVSLPRCTIVPLDTTPAIKRSPTAFTSS